jgi:hypothetical protein
MIVKAKARFVLNMVSRSDIQRPKEKNYPGNNNTTATIQNT